MDTKALLSDAMASPPSPGSPPTIVHEIIQSGLPPSEKKFSRVLDDVATVTGAGFETTASVLRLIMYHVFSNDKILQRLRTELSGVSADPDTKILEQLPYLTSVIMEGMRLSPAIGSRMARLTHDRDIHYGKWRIPASTPVGMTTILMHTDEELYPEPLSYIPDRWMDSEVRKKLEKTYAPFSRGTRSCLGMQ
jgi:cytochrome P450